MKPLIRITTLCLSILIVFSCQRQRNQKQTANYSDVAQYLSDTIRAPVGNIINTKLVFAEERYKIYESVVVSSTNNAVGYVPEHICGTYYTFTHDQDTLGFARLEHFEKLWEHQGRYYFIGNTSFRGLGNLAIITLSAASLDVALKEELYVLNNSLECNSYCDSNGYLSRRVFDFNADHIPDVEFTGTSCNYCDSLETGYGRTDRIPLSKSPLKFRYVSDPELITSDLNWILDTIQ